jgi:hypothetical protein
MADQAKIVRPQTKTEMCRYARGFPVNLQLLGFYSYQLDKDSHIDDKDLNFAVDYIVDNIKRGEFLAKHESIGYGTPEKILKHIIKHKQGFIITFENLISGLQEETEHDILNVFSPHQIYF